MMKDQWYSILVSVGLFVIVMGIFLMIAHSADKDRDEFRRQCRARGGVPVIEREQRCMAPEMFR